MELVALSGKVSNLMRSSTTTGEISQGRGDIRTSHKTTFRVNGRPVEFESAPELADGDLVSVAGTDRGGLMRGLALRNDSTNTVWQEGTYRYVYPIFGIIAGILTIPLFGAGLIILGYSVWALNRAKKNKEEVAAAVARVRSMPSAAGAPGS
jgi:hypothetical protein